MLREFKEFAMRGNAIDLAIGIVIGVAFGAIINSLVNDIIMPPIGFVAGNLDFSNLFIDLSGQGYPNLAAAEAAGAPTINYGRFINTVINFLIVAFALFIVVKQINRMKRAPEDKPAEAPQPPRQEALLEEIRDLLQVR